MRVMLLTLLFAAPALADTTEAVQTHIRPGFGSFADAAQNLASIDSCDPNTLRPAFQSVYDAWMGVAHLTLGPAEEEGRGLAVSFWPDPRGLGWKAQRHLLSGDPKVLKLEDFAQQSVAARGLPALERLLYPVDPLPADACPLIQVTADDLARTAAAINAGWGPFGDLLLGAGQSGNTTFLTTTEARQALFTQLATGLETLADGRLGRPLGTFDKPRPDLAEARASGRSLQNVILSLRGMRALAQTLSPDSTKTLAAFDHALSLSENLDDPVFAGVADPQGRLKVEILQQAVRATRDAVITEVAAALDVTLGFNAGDGD